MSSYNWGELTTYDSWDEPPSNPKSCFFRVKPPCWEDYSIIDRFDPGFRYASPMWKCPKIGRYSSSSHPFIDEILPWNIWNQPTISFCLPPWPYGKPPCQQRPFFDPPGVPSGSTVEVASEWAGRRRMTCSSSRRSWDLGWWDNVVPQFDSVQLVNISPISRTRVDEWRLYLYLLWFINQLITGGYHLVHVESCRIMSNHVELCRIRTDSECSWTFWMTKNWSIWMLATEYLFFGKGTSWNRMWSFQFIFPF